MMPQESCSCSTFTSSDNMNSSTLHSCRIVPHVYATSMTPATIAALLGRLVSILFYNSNWLTVWIPCIPARGTYTMCPLTHTILPLSLKLSTPIVSSKAHHSRMMSRRHNVGLTRVPSVSSPKPSTTSTTVHLWRSTPVARCCVLPRPRLSCAVSRYHRAYQAGI